VGGGAGRTARRRSGRAGRQPSLRGARARRCTWVSGVRGNEGGGVEVAVRPAGRRGTRCSAARRRGLRRGCLAKKPGGCKTAAELIQRYPEIVEPLRDGRLASPRPAPPPCLLRCQGLPLPSRARTSTKPSADPTGGLDWAVVVSRE
jgi:hypothetical protein